MHSSNICRILMDFLRTSVRSPTDRNITFGDTYLSGRKLVGRPPNFRSVETCMRIESPYISVNFTYIHMSTFHEVCYETQNLNYLDLNVGLIIMYIALGVRGLYWVTFSDWTPMLWSVCGLVTSENNHHKDTFEKEIRLRLQILLTSPYSISTTIGRIYVFE